MTRLEKDFATQRVRLERRLPSYWRVTFDHPPLNIFGPQSIPQLNEIITALETDEQVKVVVFDSAVEGFFLTHYDFLAPLEEFDKHSAGTDRPAGAARHVGAPKPRAGGVDRFDPRTGDGRRQRACIGERHALCKSRKGDPVAMGSRRRPRSRRRTDGAIAASGRSRARAGDSARLRRHHGELAERYGYVNRSLPDAELGSFVDALAMRIASFDKAAIADTKRLVDKASLPADADIAPEWDAFIASLGRPATQARIKALMARGFHRPGDVENRLGHYVGQLGN